MDKSIDIAVKTMKETLLGASWWKHVQPETAEKLQSILNNLITMGPLFKRAFIESFKYSHAHRVVTGKSVPSDIPGALFGRAMSEECYQSGIGPVKHLLDLSDWIKPNDADVQACMHVCQQIEILEKLGIFEDGEIKLTEDKHPTKGMFSDIINWPKKDE